MKKLISMIVLGAISFGSVYAIAAPRTANVIQTDTTKKKKMKPMKKDTTTKKKDTMAVKH